MDVDRIFAVDLIAGGFGGNLARCAFVRGAASRMCWRAPVRVVAKKRRCDMWLPSLPLSAQGLLCFLSLFHCGVRAAPPQLIGGDVAPYSWEQHGTATGPASELVREMARRLGYRDAAIVIYPWARTLQRGERDDNTLIFPVSRIASRESKYTWIVELLQDQYVLVSKGSTTVDLTTLENLPVARIGYLRGSPGEFLLEQAHRQSQGRAVGSELLNAKKLDAGRIDFWLANRKLAAQAWSDIGGHAGALRFGPPILQLHMYLVAPRAFPLEELRKWRVSFDAMLADGTCSQILAKYHAGPCGEK
jgi:polar amino acid transport system substrate-binding protein